MSSAQRTAWFLIVGLVLSMVVLCCEARANTASVRTALGKLAVFHEDIADPRKPEQLDAIAAAVGKLKPPQGISRGDWQALVIAVGFHESGYSLRIGDGNCRTHECDHGRARSYWQLHANLHTAGFWDQLVGNKYVEVQARVASEMLARAYYLCRGTQSDWSASMLSAFSGRRCDAQWSGLATRIETWKRLRGAL